ncbi:MAG TPA: DUF1326 domain-containing protein [Bryobacterales bacterium]|nr:DUF1326 domain-containing protein [Bryobacterales bacterium]
MAEPYSIKVHHLEACNCNHGCGCQFAGFPDHGFCEAVMGLEVIEGHYGSTDLSGARLVLAAKWPKAIHEGNGTCVLFIGDEATPEQVEGLGMIFSGQAGGMPWEAIAGTMVSVTGPIVTKIDMKVDGNQSSFNVPGFVEMRLTALSDVMSGEPKDVHIVYPQGGFLWDDARIGTTETMRVQHEALSFEHPGRFAAYATPVWTNQS